MWDPADFHVSSMHSVPPNRPENVSDSSCTNFIAHTAIN